MSDTPLNIPESALIAWESMLKNLPPSLAKPAPEAFHGFALSQLPGFAKIAHASPDDWVLDYQHALEKQHRKQRQAGEKQNGVFYTPQPVAAYLTQRTLGRFLDKAKTDIQAALRRQDRALATAIYQQAQAIKIADPACGTGVFLMEALRCLQNFYQDIQESLALLAWESGWNLSAEPQLYGWDIDPMGVWITEFRLAQCARFQPETSLAPARITCGDTLQQALDVHFDFILGNPPYISQVRGQAGRFQALQGQPGYQAKMDLCDAFLYWSLHALKPEGQLAQVLPAYWTQRSGTRAVRQALWETGHLAELWAFAGQTLFPNAPGHHSALLIWRKNAARPEGLSTRQETWFASAEQASQLASARLQPVQLQLDSRSGKLHYGDPVEMALLEKLNARPPLFLPHQIQQGVVIPQGQLKQRDVCRLPPDLQGVLAAGAGIFVLSSVEIETLGLNPHEQALLQPFFTPAGFEAFSGFPGATNAHYLIYTDAENRKKMEKRPQNYPQLRAHLSRFESLLTSDFKPYGLHRARQPEWFEARGKIMCPRQVMTPACAVIDFPAYVNEGFYILRPDGHGDEYTAFLNAKLGWFWFYMHKRKGRQLQIDKDVLQYFPAPVDTQPFPRLREVSQALRRNDGLPEQKTALLAQLNTAVYEAYCLSDAEINWIDRQHAERVAG